MIDNINDEYNQLIIQFAADELSKADFKRLWEIRNQLGKGIQAFLEDAVVANTNAYWTLIEMKRTVGLTDKQSTQLGVLAKELGRDITEDMATEAISSAADTPGQLGSLHGNRSKRCWGTTNRTSRPNKTKQENTRNADMNDMSDIEEN